MMNKERFDQLTEGLLFMSETDAPLTYYELSPEKSQEWPPSTGGQFLQLIGEDQATHVEKLAPEKFFRDLRPGNEDREDQVAALQNAMTGELRNLEGFRVGEIQINIFVLGTDDSGKAAGLRTLSVET
jgi:histidine triad (HIT) family protein